MFHTRDGKDVLCIVEGQPYSLDSLVWDINSDTSDALLNLNEIPDSKDSSFELHASGMVYFFSLHTTLKFDQEQIELGGKESSRRPMSPTEQANYFAFIL